MAERKRSKEIHFYVTEEERKLIRRKMIESKTKNMGAYLRKMAIDGYIVNTDTTPLKKQYEEMHKIGVNINQIAKKVNSTGDLYPEEMQELKEMVKELWRILRSCLDNFKRYADSHFIFNHFSLFSFSINISGKVPRYSGNSAYIHYCIFCKARCR